jgi:hypothetical protein
MYRLWIFIASACLIFSGLWTLADDDISTDKPDGKTECKYVKLVNVDTGKILAVENDSGARESRAVLSDDCDKPSRQWKLETDSGFFKLANRENGLVVDVAYESLEDGSIVIVWDDKPDLDDNQRWKWEPAIEPVDRAALQTGHRLKSKFSGLVLDVDGLGGLIQSQVDEKAKSQLWRVIEIPLFVKIVHVETGKVLGIKYDSEDNAVQAVLAQDVQSTDKNSLGRQWKIAAVGNSIMLINRKSGKALEVSNSSDKEGGLIIQYDVKPKSDGNDNQHWIWASDTKDSDKGRRLKSISSGLVLDVNSDGKVIQQLANENVKSQLWRVVTVTD